MRLIFSLAAVAGALGLTAPLPQSDCAEPSIVIEGSPSSGETVVIEADGFAAGCGEAGSEGSAESGSEAAGSGAEAGSETGTGAAGGCSVEGSSAGSGQSTEDTGSGQPVQNIRVTIIQDGETYVLGVRDGDESSAIRIEAELPEELHEGSATLHAEGDGGEGAEATVTIVERP